MAERKTNKPTPKSYTLPSNVEAERTVLGSMILDYKALNLGMAAVMADDISGVDNRNVYVYQAIKELYDRKQTVDIQTVHGKLVDLKTAEEVDSPAYLQTLVDSVIDVDNMDHYIRMVKDQAVLRRFLVSIKKVETDYASGGIEDVSEFIQTAVTKLDAIASDRSVGDFRRAGDIAKAVQKNIDEMAKNTNDKGLTGVDTGYRRLNQFTHGWQKEDLIIVAARPSMGKTALAMNFAFNAAIKGTPVAFFSLEMNAESIMKRFLAMASSVPNDRIQLGKLSPQERVKLAEAVDKLSAAPLYIDDTPNSVLGDVVSKANKLKTAEPRLGLIVVDYLGKVTLSNSPSGKGDSRQQEVSIVCSAFKTLARQLHVPIMLICQLNRDSEKNSESHVPMLSNLRESGSIEQDADQVMLLYRKDYYSGLGQNVKSGGKGNWSNNKFTKKLEEQQNQANEGASAPEIEAAKEAEASIMHVLLAKNRNGKVGTAALIFSKAFSKFDDPSVEFETKLEEYESRSGGDSFEG